MKHIRIASRASKLALAQTNIVKEALENLSDDVEISIVTISTKGDRDKSDFLHKSESVGFFTSEVENALLDGRADMAVHSLKDLPTAYTAGLTVAAIPKREAAADALVASDPAASLEDLPPGTTVGTSSLRRIAQLHHIRGDLKCVPLRGNVETRVRKVATGQVDAAIVACAGLKRLGLADKISAVLAPEQFLNAPGQGALAVQVRAEDSELIELAHQLDDRLTRIATEAERLVLASMHGGCSIPLGVYARITEGQLKIDAMIADIKGEKYVRHSKTTCLERAASCARELANELLEAGGREILEQLRSG
ncbi:MAG: hydroxymethylbilane synthase [Planctomycetota bacterium]|nr:MAG: hydroxymethylbilane synthase [Planctomycetota bacterium]